MPTALMEPTMSTDEPKPPKVQSVKLEMDVIESARIVASCRREGLTAMLSAILRPIVAKMEREEMQKRLKASEPTRSPLPGQTSFIDPGKGRKGGSKAK
jgi:hypothetical protein